MMTKEESFELADKHGAMMATEEVYDGSADNPPIGSITTYTFEESQFLAYTSAIEEKYQAALAEAMHPDQQLCKFYSVESYPQLVKAMEHHIERLQAKVPKIRDEQPGRVREG